MPKAIILTTLPIEYEAVRIHLNNLHEETHPRGTIYERGVFLDSGRLASYRLPRAIQQQRLRLSGRLITLNQKLCSSWGLPMASMVLHLEML